VSTDQPSSTERPPRVSPAGARPADPGAPAAEAPPGPPAAPAEARLLVVDDEPNIVELLAASLRYAGFAVTTARSGREALDLLPSTRPDLVVLDVMMPGLDGFAVVKQMRGSGDHTPVLFLTARDAAEDRVAGLTLGGDDYVTKPFSLEEVIARIRAILRRAGGPTTGQPATTLSLADVELDDDTHEVWKAGQLVPLSPTEYKLLRYFLANAGRVLSKAQILDHVWAYDFGGDAGVVESYVSYLRKKVDTTEPKLLHTVRGVGYVMRVPREQR
jgi:two-component system, OmpR family, response regulator